MSIPQPIMQGVPMVQPVMVAPQPNPMMPMPMVGQPGMVMPVPMGVIIPPFNAADKAKELYIAMKGLGTDEDALIRVLGNCFPEQIQAVAVEYYKLYNKTLKAALHSETSFNFRKVLEAMVTPSAEYKADVLFRAMEGLGTSDHILTDVLTTTSNAEIRAIIDIYGQKYAKAKKEKKDPKGTTVVASTAVVPSTQGPIVVTIPVGTDPTLANDIKGDTSGDFRDILLELLSAKRDETGIIDDNTAKNDAKTLYDKGEGRIGTDDSTFIRLLTSRSWPQMQVIDKFYREVSKKKHSVLEAINSETSGHYKDTLLALAKTPDVYWAERLNWAMKGLGTDDTVLIYAIVTNRNMKKICETYNAKYGHSLESDIAGDTSGDYKNLLLEIVKFRSKF